jgi:hypothetical protein
VGPLDPSPRAAPKGKMPLVSVCMPTFQGERYLAEALDSALAQTGADLEVVIVDDASRDGTAALAGRYVQRDPRVSLHVNERTLGLVGNWNACLARARGEWIKFLFQDDLLDPNCIERLVAAARPDVGLVVCRRRTIVAADASEALRSSYQAYAAEHDFARRFGGATHVAAPAFAAHLLAFPSDNCLGEPVAMLVRSSAIARFGGFHAHLLQLVDWEFAARIAANTGLCHVPEPLASFRLHGGSMTSTSAAGRRYRKEVLDPLVVLHELVHGVAYAGVRELARRSHPPVDLELQLAAACRSARKLAKDCTTEDERERMLAEWRALTAALPALGRPSLRLAWARVAGRLRRSFGRRD